MNVSDKVGSEQELTAESSPVSGPDRGPKRWGQDSDKVNEPKAQHRSAALCMKQGATKSCPVANIKNGKIPATALGKREDPLRAKSEMNHP